MSLELRGITRVVAGRPWLYPVDLCFKRGIFNILLGSTRAGKTTLMRLAAGLDTPSEGRVFFDNHDVTDTPIRKRNVSMVYQQFINYPHFSVFDNIAAPLRLLAIDRNVIRKRVETIAELLRITPILDRKPGEISGGQQQRTALARALVKEADLVLLDEPLANLDFKLREELRDELPYLFAQRQCVVLYATSEPSEALLLEGCCAVLHEGRVTASGTTREVYRHPPDLTTAHAFCDPPLNVATVIKCEGHIHFGTVSWPVTPRLAALGDGEYIMGVRPHHLTLPDRQPTSLRLDGAIRVVELNGSETLLHVEVQQHAWTSLSQGVYSCRAGTATTLSLDTESCLYFTPDGRRIVCSDEMEL